MPHLRLIRIYYSVPVYYAWLKVLVMILIDQVEIFHNGKNIATHQRVFMNNKWQLDPQDYLEIILQRPGVFYTARPVRQQRKHQSQSLATRLQRFHESLVETAGIKDFIFVADSLSGACARRDIIGIELAMENHISTSEGVEHILLHAVYPGATSLLAFHAHS